MKRTMVAIAALMLLGLAPAAFAQTPLLNANEAGESELLKAPHMTPATVKAIIAARPLGSITDLHKLLLAHKLTVPQATAFYQRAFIPLNLNTATDEQILLIPGTGKRMLHEFKEYRPWKTRAQFDKEIGKYVDAKEVARLAAYVVIP